MDIIVGDWTKLDVENKITEVSFSVKDELIAKMIFDFANDNFVVELAVASGAEALITYNVKDFKNAELIFKHKIITPEDFIKEML